MRRELVEAQARVDLDMNPGTAFGQSEINGMPMPHALRELAQGWLRADNALRAMIDAVAIHDPDGIADGCLICHDPHLIGCPVPIARAALLEPR